MKCVTHNKIDAVSSCHDCGAGLCQECTRQFEIPICPSCNLARSKVDNRVWWRNLALTCIAFVVGLIAARNAANGEMSLGLQFLFAYALAGIPFGWSALSRITPNVFLVLPLAGWAVYFMFKFILAYWVGLVALPYALFKLIRDRRRIAALANDISALEPPTGQS